MRRSLVAHLQSADGRTESGRALRGRVLRELIPPYAASIGGGQVGYVQRFGEARTRAVIGDLIPEQAGAAAYHSLAIAEQIVGEAEAGLDEEWLGREARYRNARVDPVPLQACPGTCR